MANRSSHSGRYSIIADLERWEALALVSEPEKVRKQRHPFDIYQDQYEALQELALEERKLGGIGSMSAMVREATDRLIAERRGVKK